MHTYKQYIYHMQYTHINRIYIACNTHIQTVYITCNTHIQTIHRYVLSANAHLAFLQCTVEGLQIVFRIGGHFAALYLCEQLLQLRDLRLQGAHFLRLVSKRLLCDRELGIVRDA